MRVIGLAMQQAMKAQQTYAGFVARGDELFTGLRGEDEPGLATFDDEDEAAALERRLPRVRLRPRRRTEPRRADLDPRRGEVGEDIDEAQQSLEVLADEAPDTEAILDEIAIDELVDQAPTLEETAPHSRRSAPKTPKASHGGQAPEEGAGARKPSVERRGHPRRRADGGRGHHRRRPHARG